MFSQTRLCLLTRTSNGIALELLLHIFIPNSQIADCLHHSVRLQFAAAQQANWIKFKQFHFTSGVSESKLFEPNLSRDNIVMRQSVLPLVILIASPPNSVRSSSPKVADKHFCTSYAKNFPNNFWIQKTSKPKCIYASIRIIAKLKLVNKQLKNWLQVNNENNNLLNFFFFKSTFYKNLELGFFHWFKMYLQCFIYFFS